MCPKLDSQQCEADELAQNVNNALCQNSTQILSQELKKDDFTEVVSATLENDNANKKSIISDEQWLADYNKKLIGLSSPYALQYHQSEVKNATKILNFLLWIFVGTTLSTIALVAICIFKDINSGAIISGTMGAIIDIVIAWMIKVYSMTLQSKKSYFDAENETEKMNKMLFVLQTISCQDTKDQVIADILRKYFDVDKGK